MSARGTALATRHRPPDSDALVVVADRPDVPGWVVDWCRRAGRTVRLQPAAATAEDRINAVAAMAGRSVLVRPRAPDGPGVPDLPSVPVRRAGPAPGTRPRVVAAVRDLRSDGAVLAEAAEAADQLDAALVLAHGVPLSFGERSVGLADALDRGRAVLAEAADRVASTHPGRTVTTRLLRLRPYELVGEQLDADLLVIGGSRPRIPARLGLVACSALQHAPCPVLLTPRPA
jgi:nucleotide-binding universal stress UspA family protein